MDVHDVDEAAAARHERGGDQGDEHRRRRGRPGGARDRQGARRHVRELLDRRHLADERQAERRLDASREFRDSDWLPAKVYGPLGRRAAVGR